MSRALGDLVPRHDARVPPAGLSGAEPDERLDQPHGRARRLRRAGQHLEPPENVAHTGDEQRDGALFQLTAPACLGNDRGLPGARCGSGGHPAEPGLRWRLSEDVRQPERDSELVRATGCIRLDIQRERLQVLDEVAAVQVDEHVGGRDQLVEDRARSTSV